jgi:hypothetical protein
LLEKKTKAMKREQSKGNQATPKLFSSSCIDQTWLKRKFSKLCEVIKGIENKDNQAAELRKVLGTTHIEEPYPSNSWTRVYTNGSATNAVENGGGVLILLNDCEQRKVSVATGKFLSNFRAEVEALKTAAISILSEKRVKENVVFLTDALSVISALKSHRDKSFNELQRDVNQICAMFERVVI